jgi:hypothetical protein
VEVPLRQDKQVLKGGDEYDLRGCVRIYVYGY